MDLSPLEKEEFIQSYLQYRWLDETRSKLIDRFFIIVLALLGARLQFDELFSKNPNWLLVLYGLAIVVIFLMARSIVTFRRQQRGHIEFIRAIRKRLLSGSNKNEFEVFGDFLRGKRVHLTKWMELISVIFAVLSPALFLDTAANVTRLINRCFGIFLGIVVALLIFYFVAVPFWKYNCSEKINWDKD